MRVFRLCFHVHTRASKDSRVSPRKLFERCKHLGVDGVIISDHNSSASIPEAKELAAEYGIETIPAVEYLTDAGDLVGVGVDFDLPERTPFAEVANKIRDEGGLCVLPHPYNSHKLDLVDWGLVDIVETFNARSSSSANAKSALLALRLQKPAIVGNDAHLLSDVGRVINVYELEDGAEFGPAVLLGGPKSVECRRVRIGSIEWSQLIKYGVGSFPRLAFRSAKGTIRRLLGD